MRATVLLPISIALACGGETLDKVTAQLVMSSSPADWCGDFIPPSPTNKDNIRMDCPFQMGIYFVDADAGTVLNTTCVSVTGAMDRTWKDIPQTLNGSMVMTSVLAQAPVRLEVAVIEPPASDMCAHEGSAATPKFRGSSSPIMPDDPTVKRIEVSTKCLKPFTATATCLH